MKPELLYTVIDENMGDKESMGVSELNDKMGSPWNDSELASRVDDTPVKCGDGFSTDVVCGSRRVYRTC